MHGEENLIYQIIVQELLYSIIIAEQTENKFKVLQWEMLVLQDQKIYQIQEIRGQSQSDSEGGSEGLDQDKITFNEIQKSRIIQSRTPHLGCSEYLICVFTLQKVKDPNNSSCDIVFKVRGLIKQVMQSKTNLVILLVIVMNMKVKIQRYRERIIIKKNQQKQDQFQRMLDSGFEGEQGIFQERTQLLDQGKRSRNFSFLSYYQ